MEFEQLDAPEKEEEFTLFGTGLDNIDDLSPNQLTHLRKIHQMISKTVIRILEAYAIFDQEIGYVQGMHSIAVAIVYNFFMSMLEHYKLWKKVTTQNEFLEAELIHQSEYLQKKVSILQELEEIKFKMQYSEAEMFETLVGMMQNLNLHLCFGNDFSFLKCRIDTFGLLIQEKLYPVYLKLT
jgi:hypothetical protein